jgi:hypothetical protein
MVCIFIAGTTFQKSMPSFRGKHSTHAVGIAGCNTSFFSSALARWHGYHMQCWAVLRAILCGTHGLWWRCRQCTTLPLHSVQRCQLDTPHSYNRHWKLYETLHSTPRTLDTLIPLHVAVHIISHSALCSFHSTLNTLHLSIPILHFRVCTSHSALHVPRHFAHTPHRTLLTPDWTLYAWRSALCTLHDTW